MEQYNGDFSEYFQDQCNTQIIYLLFNKKFLRRWFNSEGQAITGNEASRLRAIFSNVLLLVISKYIFSYYTYGM